MKIEFKCPRCGSVIGANQLWCEGCGFQPDVEGYEGWEDALNEKNEDEYDWDNDY